MAPPPPPPELIDDAIAEILLHLPPDDPACLVRASLVCKLWCRILSDSTFPNRYRKFHGTPPPLLGFLCGYYASSDKGKAKRFVPITTRIPFLQPAFGCRILDCRHGRILFDMVGGTRGSLAVWDPITGNHTVLNEPHHDYSYYHTGVVICAAAGCNHRCGCHGGGPFQVLFVSSSRTYNDDDDDTIAARAWLYSSETAAWSVPVSLELCGDSHVYMWKRGALLGDQINLLIGSGILTYDLGKHHLTTISLPCKDTNCNPGMLMAMDHSSSLGFAIVKDLALHLWARKVNVNGSKVWVQERVILLDSLVPIIGTADTCRHANVIGFAEDVDILLLGEDASGFMSDLKSGLFKKLSNPEYHYYGVFPYLNFYITACARSALPSTVGDQ